MAITISRELEAKLLERAEAEGMTVNAYLEHLIQEDEAWTELQEQPAQTDGPQSADVHTAVAEGLEQAERGESRPAEDVFRGLRAKHGLSR